MKSSRMQIKRPNDEKYQELCTPNERSKKNKKKKKKVYC